MRIEQGRRDDKTHLLRAAHLVARELYGALRYRLEAAHAAAREVERGAGEFVKPRSCISIHRCYKRYRGGVMRGYLEG